MSASDITVINTALRKLGEQPLTARTDPSPPGRIANATYDEIRDSLLREAAWNFATKRTRLAADATAPDWGYDNQYTLPSDFLRLMEIYNTSDIEWRLEGNKILTNLDAPLKIIYIASVAENEMDVAFREALSARCAMEWAEALSQTSTVGDQMAAIYRNKLQIAKTADGQEDRQRTIDAPDFILSRF